MIMTVLAGIGYVIDRGIGNLFVLFLILYVFNHYVLTPKLIVPFQESMLPALKNGYRRLISWILTGWRPVLAIVAAFGLLILTFIIVGIAKPKVLFFPSGEPDYIYVYNVMPIGTDARVTDSVTRVIEKRVFKVLDDNKATDIVNSVISNVGKNAGDPMNPDRSATPQKSKVTIAFKPNEERHGISTDSLLSKVRVAVSGLPGSELSVERESNGPPTGKPIAIEIAGEEFDELQKTGKTGSSENFPGRYSGY